MGPHRRERVDAAALLPAHVGVDAPRSGATARPPCGRSRRSRSSRRCRSPTLALRRLIGRAGRARGRRARRRLAAARLVRARRARIRADGADRAAERVGVRRGAGARERATRLALWALAAAAAIWTHWFAGFLVLARGRHAAVAAPRRVARHAARQRRRAARARAARRPAARPDRRRPRRLHRRHERPRPASSSSSRQFGAGIDVPRTWLEARAARARARRARRRHAAATVAGVRGRRRPRDAAVAARALPPRDGARALLALALVGLLVPLALAATGLYDRFNVRNVLYLWPLLAALAAPALLRMRAAPARRAARARDRDLAVDADRLALRQRRLARRRSSGSRPRADGPGDRRHPARRPRRRAVPRPLAHRRRRAGHPPRLAHRRAGPRRRPPRPAADRPAARRAAAGRVPAPPRDARARLPR